LFDNRTRATFRSAEFGFLGVIVLTIMQTPRRCGQSPNSRDFDFRRSIRRGRLHS
jgi:hypothetical protein